MRFPAAKRVIAVGLLLGPHCSNVASDDFDRLLVCSLGAELQDLGRLLEHGHVAGLEVADSSELGVAQLRARGENPCSE